MAEFPANASSRSSALVAVVLTALATLVACGGGGGGGGSGGANTDGSTSPTPAPPPVPVSFTDVTASSGINYVWGYNEPAFQPVNGPESQILTTTFGGVASGDCDNDGDIDLFITYGDMNPNRLYLNQLVEQGDGLRFVDNAAAAGVANTRTDGRGNDRHSGPAFADLDGDGDLDLAMGGLFRDPFKVYRNDGDCTFTDVTSNSPELVAMLSKYTISVSFGDYDLDGDLDMFLAHWGTEDVEYRPDEFAPLPWPSEHLWENVSDGSGIMFVNASIDTDVGAILWSTRDYLGSTGAPQIHDYTYTGTMARLNDDVWPDILVVGDFGSSRLLVSEGDGTFSNLTNTGLSGAQQAMGSALGDFDNDGDLDWFVTSIMGFGDDSLTNWGNRLYRNRAELAPGFIRMDDFTDNTCRSDSVNLECDPNYSGIADGGWGWAACFLDIDNDTDLDIYHTNGWWAAPGAEGRYTSDASRVFVYDGVGYDERAGDFGLADRRSARGAVCADFDGDGDVDIFQTTADEPNSGYLMENRTAVAGNNYLTVELNGLPPNTEAAGARIFVRILSDPDAATQMREVMIGSNNYTSQNPAVQYFGLGPATVVAEVRVEWPARVDGLGVPVQPADSVLTNVAANRRLQIDQPL